MGLFEVFIPASEPDGFNITARIRAESWIAALKSGLTRLGDGADIRNIFCDITDQGIDVTEPASGRVFRIREITEAQNPPSPPGASPVGARGPASPTAGVAYPAATGAPPPAASTAVAAPHSTATGAPPPAAHAPPAAAHSPAPGAPPPAAHAPPAAAHSAATSAPPPAAGVPPAAPGPAATGAPPPAAGAPPPAAGAPPATAHPLARGAPPPAAGAPHATAHPLARGAPPPAAGAPPAAAHSAAAGAPPSAAGAPHATAHPSARGAPPPAVGAPAAAAHSVATGAPPPAVGAPAAAAHSVATGARPPAVGAPAVAARSVATGAPPAAARSAATATPGAAVGSVPGPNRFATAAVEESVTEQRASAATAPKIGRSLEPDEGLEDVLSDLMMETQAAYEQPDLAAAAAHILNVAIRVIPAESGAVFIADINRRDLYFGAAFGPKADEVMAFRVPMGQGIVGFSAQEGVSLSVADAHRDPRFYRAISEKLGYETHSIICAPVQQSGRVYGALELINRRQGTAFAPRDVTLLNFLAHEFAQYLINSGQTGA